MYAIRVDTRRHVLEVEFSGRMVTAEAVRAVAQAAALAEAGGLRAVACDLRGLQRGPAGLLKVAALVALRFQPGMRLALVGGAGQGAFADRFIAFSGMGDAVQLFEDDGDAHAWLEPVLRKAGPRVSSTELRHANEILAAPRRGKRARTPVMDSSSGRQPAA